MLRRLTTFIILVVFSVTTVIPPAYAQPLVLPQPGTMITLSPVFIPPILKGIKIFPNDPLKFDFILDTGNSRLEGDGLEEESSKLIKYFLATLTVPDDDLWVNLSPYEKDRIIPDQFGVTEMGRDLLAQDYILKQLTASLIYPEQDLGKMFWEKVRAKIQALYGKDDIPVDTFNKVWVVPDKAVVYENGDMAYIVESHLKVMMEEDYIALRASDQRSEVRGNNSMTEIMREVVVPEIEKEINHGENFAALRQIYHSMILATWFKRNLRESILGKVYVGGNKVSGVDVEDREVKQKIYDQYLEAFRVGVYNYIKEEYDPGTQEVVPKKYFSGGMQFEGKAINAAMLARRVSDTEFLQAAQKTTGESLVVEAALDPITNVGRANPAMLSELEARKIYEDALVVRRGLPPWEELSDETKWVIQRFWSDGSVRKLSEISGASYLFNDGFSTLIKTFGKGFVTVHWDDLVEMDLSATPFGWDLFEAGLPALKEAFGQEFIEQNWNDLADLGKSPAGYVLLRYGLPHVKHVIKTSADLKDVKNAFMDIQRAGGKEADLIFRGLYVYKELIKTPNDLNRLGTILAELAGKDKGIAVLGWLSEFVLLFDSIDQIPYWANQIEQFIALSTKINDPGNFAQQFKDTGILEYLHGRQADSKRHFSFYLKLLNEHPGQGYLTLQGLFEAIKKGVVSADLSEQEQEKIIDVIDITGDFDADLYSVYVEEGSQRLEEKFGKTQRKIETSSLVQLEETLRERYHVTLDYYGYGHYRHDGFYVDDTVENHKGERPRNPERKADDMAALSVLVDEKNSGLFLRFGDVAIADPVLRDAIPSEFHDKVIFINIAAQHGSPRLLNFVLPFLAQIYRSRDQIQGKTVLELGMGGGIASIFALKLGAQKVVGVEKEQNQRKIFDQAIKDSGVNEDQIVFIQGAFKDQAVFDQLKDLGPFDVVLANIGPHAIYSEREDINFYIFNDIPVDGANIEALELSYQLQSSGSLKDFLYIGGGFSGGYRPDSELKFLRENFALSSPMRNVIRRSHYAGSPMLYEAFEMNVSVKAGERRVFASNPAMLALHKAKVGDMVRHAEFGDGEIISIERTRGINISVSFLTGRGIPVEFNAKEAVAQLIPIEGQGDFDQMETKRLRQNLVEHYNSDPQDFKNTTLEIKNKAAEARKILAQGDPIAQKMEEEVIKLLGSTALPPVSSVEFDEYLHALMLAALTFPPRRGIDGKGGAQSVDLLVIKNIEEIYAVLEPEEIKQFSRLMAKHLAWYTQKATSPSALRLLENGATVVAAPLSSLKELKSLQDRQGPRELSLITVGRKDQVILISQGSMVEVAMPFGTERFFERYAYGHTHGQTEDVTPSEADNDLYKKLEQDGYKGEIFILGFPSPSVAVLNYYSRQASKWIRETNQARIENYLVGAGLIKKEKTNPAMLSDVSSLNWYRGPSLAGLSEAEAKVVTALLEMSKAAEDDSAAQQRAEDLLFSGENIFKLRPDLDVPETLRQFLDIKRSDPGRYALALRRLMRSAMILDRESLEQAREHVSRTPSAFYNIYFEGSASALTGLAQKEKSGTLGQTGQGKALQLTAAGLIDLKAALVPEAEEMEQLTAEQKLKADIAAYINRYLEGEKRETALRNMEDPYFWPFIQQARRHNILLVISRPIDMAKSEDNRKFSQYFPALMRALERIPAELLWEVDQPIGFEVTKLTDRQKGFYATVDEEAGAGMGVTQFSTRDKKKFRFFFRSEPYEYNEQEMTETLVHEILGHKRSLMLRSGYEIRQGRLVKLPNDRELVMRREDWIRVSYLNGIRTVLPLSPEMQAARERMDSLIVQGVRVEDLPRNPNEFLDTMRNLLSTQFSYYESPLEIVAYSAADEDLSRPAKDVAEVRHSEHKLRQTRNILKRGIGRLGIPVDPVRKVYQGHIYDRTAGGFETYYLQNQASEDHPLWREVELRDGQWAAKGALEAPEANPAMLAVLSPDQAGEFKKAAPHLDWTKAAEVLWEELVRDPEREPRPETEKQKNYLRNQVLVRNDFLRMIRDLAAGELTDGEEFVGRMQEMHRHLLIGENGDSAYVSKGDNDIGTAQTSAGVLWGDVPYTERLLVEMMKSLQQFIKVSGERKTLREKLAPVADLYDAMINAPRNMFPYGNHSWQMHLINIQLRLLGLNGIPHGYLDELVKSGMETDVDVKAHFFDYVGEANPGVNLGAAGEEAANPAMLSLRPEDIQRLAPVSGETILIETELGGRQYNVPHEILAARQDEAQRTLFHLRVLSTATDEERDYDYDVAEAVGGLKLMEGDLEGFESFRTEVAGVLWEQYTDRIYRFLTDKNHPDVAEEGKWRLYLRPADKISFETLINIVKNAARTFKGPVEFKYIARSEPTLDQKLSDPKASRFVINFVSREDALEFYRLLQQDPGYGQAKGIGQTPEAEALDELAALAQGHTATRMEPDGSFNAAMLGKRNDSVGGIDMNPNKLDLETQGQGVDIQVPVNLENLQNMPLEGFAPVIIQIIPANLPLLMGLKEEEEPARVSRL